MDGPAENLSHITCLLCGGLFLYPGPRYPLHLFTCHGVVEEGPRDYLVKASEYQMKNGELPEINTPEDVAMNVFDYNKNENHLVDDGDNENDSVSVRRVVLTPVKNRDPRLRRTQSTPRRNWSGEDDKDRDPDFSLGKGKKSTGGKHLCVTCGRYYASKTTLSKHRRQVCEGKVGKVVCVTCGRQYASKDTLNKHQRLVCEGSPLYQNRAAPVTSTPNPYNNNDERRMTFG